MIQVIRRHVKIMVIMTYMCMKVQLCLAWDLCDPPLFPPARAARKSGEARPARICLENTAFPEACQ
jgi:hypothetical protein